MKDHMTVMEAAAALGIEASVLRRRLESGTMQGERVHPRLWLITKDEVERWRARGKLAPGRKPKAPPAPPVGDGEAYGGAR